MILDLFLILISALFIFLFFKNKSQIKKLEQKLMKPDNVNYIQREEFSLGLTRLNSEFDHPIVLDTLTGLPGREAFNERFLQTINQSQRFEKLFGVMLLDIDQFSMINESWDYDTGDKLLREIGLRLKGLIRQIDTVTRLAGNTFILLLPQLSTPETAVYVAQRLLDNILQPFQIDDKKIFISASIGISVYPSDGHEMEMLIKNAQSALHQAKDYGKGRYQFYKQDIHALGQRELALNNFLSNPQLLQKLLIYYQPQMNVLTNEILSIQAVPHFYSKEYGLVTFSEFSTIAENIGKIQEIGEWLLRNAIVQYKKWQKDGFKPKYLYVNVTLRQIQKPQFIEKVIQILQELQLSPKQVIFEITSRPQLSDVDGLTKTFDTLSNTGIQIAISMLALGQLALQKISKLPVNYLKINANMVQDKKLYQQNEVILHTIVSLAKTMRIEIIADGVENEKQKIILQELGCEIMQGKLFGEPLPIVDDRVS